MEGTTRNKIRKFTWVASLAAASLSSNFVNIVISDTSGGRLAIRSRIFASLDAEFSKLINALINSSGSGGSPKHKMKKNVSH